MRFTTINPATGETIGSYKTVSSEESLRYAKAAKKSFEHWGKLDINERADYLNKLASSLRAKKEKFARLITLEMGKPIKQSIAEIEKCAWTAEVYAKNGPEWLEKELFQTDAKRSEVIYQPLGMILSIMPWNFPFWQAIRFGIPTLLAGNTTLLRHSRIVPQCAVAIKQTFMDAGFPDDVFSVIITDHSAVETLIGSDYVDGVSFTGSVPVGLRIGELTGRYIKKLVLELGGSDPFIVLGDANVEEAARNAAESRLINSGQSCVAAKRFLIVEEIKEEFNELFVRCLEKYKVGDPTEMETDVGPLVRKEHVQLVEAQLSDAMSKGGQILTGGEKMAGPGYFYLPTAIGNSTSDMRVVREEVFGPIAPIISVQGRTDVVRVANNSDFGLAASLWTGDLECASRLARLLDVGVVFINSIVKSDPRMPFGGVKKSGFGRELSKHGIREFVNVKGINIYPGS